MTNERTNKDIFNLRQNMLNIITSLESKMKNEMFRLECYEEGSFPIDSDGRNKKGQYVNLKQMRENIKNMEETLKMMQDTLGHFSVSASEYK